jgi:hypothetical protein
MLSTLNLSFIACACPNGVSEQQSPFLGMVSCTGVDRWFNFKPKMVYFQTENPNWGKFWSALDLKMLIYFMSISNILQTFGIFYDHLVHFVFIWYIFSAFGIIYQEKSGNPALHLG